MIIHELGSIIDLCRVVCLVVKNVPVFFLRIGGQLFRCIQVGVLAAWRCWGLEGKGRKV